MMKLKWKRREWRRMGNMSFYHRLRVHKHSSTVLYLYNIHMYIILHI